LIPQELQAANYLAEFSLKFKRFHGYLTERKENETLDWNLFDHFLAVKEFFDTKNEPFTLSESYIALGSWLLEFSSLPFYRFWLVSILVHKEWLHTHQATPIEENEMMDELNVDALKAIQELFDDVYKRDRKHAFIQIFGDNYHRWTTKEERIVPSINIHVHFQYMKIIKGIYDCLQAISALESVEFGK
jgi:hypothetical protein